jgi:hypothetical protein
MQGIKNLPFIDAAPFLPIDELRELEKEICIGIAKSKINAGIYGPGIKNEEIFKSMIGLIKKYSISNDINDQKMLKELSFDQLAIFFKLYENMYSASTVVYIRDFLEQKSFKSYIKKAKADATGYTDNAKNFPNLIKWISKLPFTEVGRTLFFLHEHDCKLLIHRDGPSYTPHKNEFLWFNPVGKKTFFIYDELNDKKHFVNTSAAFFNDLDMHGGDPVDSMSWSLRIDGVFTPEFRKQLGIENLEKY